MANPKIKKQITLPGKKQYSNNSVSRLKQKPPDYSKFFIPLIVIITAVVFANTLGNDFIDNWDDNTYVFNNEIIKSLNWISLKKIFLSVYFNNYHPLTLLSYAIEYKLFGLNPFIFHFTNYIIHLLNVILVYIFLKNFTGKFWVSAITSLFFAIHPMHVESVAWVSERKDVLYTFFFLLSLNSYNKYLLTERKITFLIWSFIWFLFSLLSKPSAVCLPFVILLMDYYVHKKLNRRNFISTIPFFITSVFGGILTIIAQKPDETINMITPLYSIVDRIFLVSYSSVYYILKVFAPFNLSALHFYPVKYSGILPIEYYLALPALLLIIWGVFKSGNFKHELIFGLLFYFITISLVLQIIPAGRAVVSERYSYVPYIGVFFIFGQFFSYIKDNKFLYGRKIKSFVSIFLIFYIVLFSFLTYERNKVWKNGTVLFTDVIKKYPDQSFAWCVRGNIKKGNNDFNGALADFNIAIKLKPDYFSYYNRGNIYNTINKFDSALYDYNKSIELNPIYAEEYNNRGILYAKINKYDKALSDYNIAIKIKPDYTEAYYNRGNIYNTINKFDSSLIDFNIAIKMKPDFPDVYFYRGNVYNRINKFDSAIANYNIAIKLRSGYTEAFNNRGISLANLNKLDESLKDFNKAVELNPKYADAYFNRGFARFYLNDKTGACNDWIIAQRYGHSKAIEALEQHCK